MESKSKGIFKINLPAAERLLSLARRFNAGNGKISIR